MVKCCAHIFLLVIISLGSPAQNTASISKIVIDYYHGGNSWGPGIYGRRELIEFTRSQNYFEVTKSYLIKYVLANDSATFYKDTASIKLSRKSGFLQHFFDNLLNELNTSRNDFTTSTIRAFLKKSTKRSIRKIAKENKDTLTSDDYDKEDRDTIYHRLQRFYMLDSFIQTHLPQPPMVVMDAYNKARIFFICNNDTTRFDIDFIDFFNNGTHLGQPIEKFHLPNLTTSKLTVNLTVNKMLLQILSVKSSLYTQLDFNSLARDYIKWYVQNEYKFD